MACCFALSYDEMIYLRRTTLERTTLERCGACNQCKAPECGMCDSCKGEGTIATRARSKGARAHTQGPCEGGQRRCVSWAEPPPQQPSSTSSWGTSSIVSEATPDNLASGATPKLLAMVSQVGGGPLDSSLGLNERLLTDWFGKQEDRGDVLKGKVDRKQEELTQLA